MKYTFLLCLSLALMLYSCEKDDIGLKDSSSKDLDSSSDFESSGSIGSSSGQAGDSTLQAGQLTAGEWNDLDNWQFWEGLIAKDTLSEYPGYWKFDDFGRLSLKLSQPN
ncbi:MAG: hypothetical protein KDD01_15275, partial [Phaeodactylibacter sp.]|nr:hypothetical protein [Phaeodactylibacter sp.]